MDYGERDQMNRIYAELTPDEIPWNTEVPPDILVDLVKCGKIKPCKAIDIGCGTGNYSLYLARNGFKMTGIDFSEKAIEIARKNAMRKKADCRFLVADVTEKMQESIKNTFDFAFEWEVLHHLFPGKREKYIENLAGILNPYAKYLSVCFSEKDPQFGGTGKYRKTRLGTFLYFSGENELRLLFEPLFRIIELKSMEISGKSGPHIVNFTFLERK